MTDSEAFDEHRKQAFRDMAKTFNLHQYGPTLMAVFEAVYRLGCIDGSKFQVMKQLKVMEDVAKGAGK